MKTCNSCGYAVPDDSKFCPKCGAKFNIDEDQKQNTGTTESEINEASGIDAWKATTAQGLICSQCQAPLQPTDEDWEKGHTTCKACGTQVQLPGHTKVNGTISLKVDNSEQVTGRLELADRAWASKNCEEALKYYTLVLEDVPGYIVAMYRKGICSIVVNRTGVSEFQIYLADASNLLNYQISQLSQKLEEEGENKSEETCKRAANSMQVLKTMGEEVYELLKSLDSEAKVQNMELNPKECQEKLNLWLIVARLYYVSSVYIYDPEYREKILYDGAIFIDKIMEANVSYVARKYHRGKTQFVPVQVKFSDDALAFLSEAHKNMVETYNNLSTRKEEEERLNKEMNSIQEEGKKLTAKRDEIQKNINQMTDQFWESNPAMKNQRTLLKALPWLVVLVGVIFAVISYFVNWLLYGIIVLVVAIIVAIIIGVPVYNNFIKSALPGKISKLQESLNETEEACLLNQKSQTNKQNEIDKFEKKKKLRAS